jgi:NRAMP (natural resistance-associated macrophage protein)-like metal ion transporter
MRSKRRFRMIGTRLALLASVIGPGIITANVDNDAGGITTYSVAGAHFGFSTLWIMPLLAVVLIIVQEMSARLGVVTGKGLADLIRESLGVKVTTFVVGVLLLANLANTISEFAGVAASLEIFGVSKYISVPIAAVLVWLLVVKGSYKTVERVFLFASAIYLAYVAAGIMEKPDGGVLARALVTPQFHMDRDFIIIAITIIGTTIAPWMQFYQQSAIADKGLKPADYAYERIDVILGSLFAIFVALFITLSCAVTLHAQNVRIETAKDAAVALRSLAGPYASVLFAIGLLNASLFSAAILPLSTAYVVCEAFGWESGVSRKIGEAPVFFGIFTAFIVMGAAVILLPIRSLVEVMLLSQTLNGILLPIILVVMLLLVNDRGLLGEKFVNHRFLNGVTILVIGLLTALTGLLVYTTIAQAVR